MPAQFISGMTTAPRQNPTIFSSMNAIVSAGFEDLHIYCEPGSCTIASPMVNCHHNQQKLGSWGNLIRAVNHLTRTYSLRDYYCFFQDDIEVAENTAEYLLDLYNLNLWPGDPNTSCLMLYSARSIHSEDSTWTQVEKPSQRYGILGLVMPAQAAHEFAEDHPEPPPSPQFSSDIYFAKWLDSKGYRQFFHSPSLIRHIGETSSIGKDRNLGGNRQCKKYLKNATQLIMNGRNRHKQIEAVLGSGLDGLSG